jgi:ComF family protein
MSSSSSAIWHSLKQLVLPQSCVVCHALLLPNMQHICLNCIADLPEAPPYVVGNETEQALLGRFYYNYAYSWLLYQSGGIAQKMMSELKYRGNSAMGVYMGKQLARKMKEYQLPYEHALVMPVPLNDKKLIKRGYNQSAIIAEAMAEDLQIKMANENILRIKNTETQTAKNREERLHNMMQAFELRNGNKIEGKQIILVDDVLTTGATIEACAKVLLKVPGVQVAVVTVARALR